MQDAFRSLRDYCEKEEFKGWDPYDGLNSKVFDSLPIKNWGFAKLAWIQFFKRSPINFRPILKVPKQLNAKGIGLFLTGYCNILSIANTGNEDYGTVEDLRTRVIEFANLLVSMQSPGYSGACWGYNFDWQARRLFLFPAYTPTVVATTFSACALFQAYEATDEQKYMDVALSSADFVINDLNRTKKNKGFLFSYSPLNGNNTVYNASLLGSKLLSYCYRYSGNKKHKELARESIIACVDAQDENGSWIYGELPTQKWIDSFHTGYNLEALALYQKITKDNSFSENVERGFKYYINNFFLNDGTPKYYNNKIYPIDIHSPAQLMATLYHLDKYDEYSDLANEVMIWTINNMQDKEGYFYYQLKKGISSKISYMRWSNAFMHYAMSYYLRLINNGV